MFSNELVKVLSRKSIIRVNKNNYFLNFRFIHSLVADYHRNLLYGVIFLYPGNNKIPDVNKRKLCLILYECNPRVLISEQVKRNDSNEKW